MSQVHAKEKLFMQFFEMGTIAVGFCSCMTFGSAFNIRTSKDLMWDRVGAHLMEAH